jgi:hypothetical protein
MITSSAFLALLAGPARADNCDLRINPGDCQNTAWTVGAVAATAAAITAILTALSGIGRTIPPPPPPPAPPAAPPRESPAPGAPGEEPSPGSPPIYVQQQDDTCGPTSIRMVINRATGRDIPENRIAGRSHQLPGGYRNNGGPTWQPWGTNAGAIADQLNGLGFDAHTGAFTPDQIAQAIREGKQVIILHNNGNGGGHFQVVAGAEDRPDGHHVFTLNDPWTGKQFRRSDLWFKGFVRPYTTIAAPPK